MDTNPIITKQVSREEKEKFLNQKAKVFWMTGLSGSGKTSISLALERILFDKGYFVQVLDGDKIRNGLNENLGFSKSDRIENLRRVAEVAKLFVESGIITITAFISPMNEIRQMARTIIGAEDFIEVYINAPLEICEARDVKGLYKKARLGLIKDFTGISSPFESPLKPDIEIRTDLMDIKESSNALLEIMLKKIG